MVFKKLWNMLGVSRRLEKWPSSTTSISDTNSSDSSLTGCSSLDCVSINNKKRFLSLLHFKKQQQQHYTTRSNGELKYAKEMSIESIDEENADLLLLIEGLNTSGHERTAKMNIYTSERKSLHRVQLNCVTIMHAKKKFNFNKKIFVDNSASLLLKKVASFS